VYGYEQDGKIQINHQPDATISVYYPDVYLQLMFRAFSRPSSGAQ
jgi:hypothetical protein